MAHKIGPPAPLRAVRVYYDPVNDTEEIELGAHHFGFGGQGDGYCYGHQSFDCIDNLTNEEREALLDC